jgi:hypothetical protein
MAMLYEDVLQKRILDAMRAGEVPVRRIVRVIPPEDTGGVVEVWYVDLDGGGDWCFLRERDDHTYELVEDYERDATARPGW